MTLVCSPISARPRTEPTSIPSCRPPSGDRGAATLLDRAAAQSHRCERRLRHPAGARHERQSGHRGDDHHDRRKARTNTHIVPLFVVMISCQTARRRQRIACYTKKQKRSSVSRLSQRRNLSPELKKRPMPWIHQGILVLRQTFSLGPLEPSAKLAH